MAHKVAATWGNAEDEQFERCGESGISAGQDHQQQNGPELEFRVPGCSPRVGGGGLRPSSSGRFGGCWEVSRPYERGEVSGERASGTPGFGRGAVLRGVFRGRLGAGVRVGLEYPWKGFSSWPYRAVPSSKIKGPRNLTRHLTEPLTSGLTAHLTVGLTFSRSPRGRAGGQTGSGDRLELAAALPLGGFQSLGDHAVVHPEPLGHHVLP